MTIDLFCTLRTLSLVQSVGVTTVKIAEVESEQLNLNFEAESGTALPIKHP